MPNPWGYAGELCQSPSVTETFNGDHIKALCGVTHTSIVPIDIGPRDPRVQTGPSRKSGDEDKITSKIGRDVLHGPRSKHFREAPDR